MQGEQHVNALAELVGAKAPAVSQHLGKLRLAGMVSVRRQGTFAFYEASDDHISRFVSLLVDHVRGDRSTGPGERIARAPGHEALITHRTHGGLMGCRALVGTPQARRVTSRATLRR